MRCSSIAERASVWLAGSPARTLECFIQSRECMTHENPATFDESLGSLGPGSQLGPYRILSLLGAGGMGQVYKAFDARLCRDVAIKVAEEQFSQRFDREVRAVAALNHPNICTVHDVGPNYLVMELIEGETLRQWLGRGLPMERKLGI